MSSAATVSVQLKANGVLLGSTVPDTDGRFVFNGVLPGEYEVRVETAVGMRMWIDWLGRLLGRVC